MNINKENKHINLINKILQDMEYYCNKCHKYQMSWCNCKFVCLRCVNLGDYLANRICHCKYEEVNKYRNSNYYYESTDDESTDHESSDDSLDDEIENFFDLYEHGEDFEKSISCYCPMCEKDNGLLSVAFRFEPAACNTFYAYNDVKVTCSNCNFSHEEEEYGNDNELFNDGLYKYKKYIENKIVCIQKEEKIL